MPVFSALFCIATLLGLPGPTPTVAIDQQCAWSKTGTNVVVDDGLAVSNHPASHLPDIPDGTRMISYEHINKCDAFDGTIVVGGPLSLSQDDAYFSYSTMMRRSVQLFADMLNNERGGVRIHGNSYGMRFQWVDDQSSKQQVTNATAHAVRGTNADFAFAGYSSGLTYYSTQQSAADGRVMMSSAASTTAVFLQNNLTFGIDSPAHSFTSSSIAALAAAARAGGTQASSLVVGLIQADAVFTRATCEGVEDQASREGMTMARREPTPASAPLVTTIPKVPTIEEAMNALSRLQEKGVDVIVGCTYLETGFAIIEALERLDYSPKAVVLTATVAMPPYADKVATGWWQGEYFLGPSSWHRTLPGRGVISNWTSQEFADRFRQRYHGAEVAYQGAAQFAAACALVAAIEAADALDTEAVAAALRELKITEFYGNISFDTNGQNPKTNVVLQYAGGSLHEQIVYPLDAVTSGKLSFPMPTWAQRRCRVLGPGMTYKDALSVNVEAFTSDECSAHGKCDEAGLCVCEEGWEGSACSHTVEETGMSTGLVVVIVCLVVVAAACALAFLWWIKTRKIRSQSKVIGLMAEELQNFKESVVGMRSVARDYFPRQGTGTIDVNDTKVAVVPPRSEDLGGQQRERVMWYWAEDVAKLSGHNPSMILAPHWVQYAGSVASELEDCYQAWKAGRSPETHSTDLADRISSTGTEAKAFAAASGTKYTINFRQMKQINAATSFQRDMLRKVTLLPEFLPPSMPTSRSAPTPESVVESLPPDLIGEVLLELHVGSLVQLSKQRPDGWAFGNVVFDIKDGQDDEGDYPEHISRDAGWFPFSCTTPPSKGDLAKLQKQMGGAGATEALQMPDTWEQVDDPLMAQRFELPEGMEKHKVVQFWMATLRPGMQVIKVERVQNMSLWQSFAVKRQTVLSRESSSGPAQLQMKSIRSEHTAVSALERVWLFHGTDQVTVPKIIQQGFNRSFCGKHATAYGKGVYFARDAAYSSNYSKTDAYGVQYMFLCRVVVGEFCQGRRDIPAPDLRDAAKHILFDSTVDTLRDPSIYVTYHDAQAYPEYLIHFKQ